MWSSHGSGTGRPDGRQGQSNYQHAWGEHATQSQGDNSRGQKRPFLDMQQDHMRGFVGNPMSGPVAPGDELQSQLQSQQTTYGGYSVGGSCGGQWNSR